MCRAGGRPIGIAVLLCSTLIAHFCFQGSAVGAEPVLDRAENPANSTRNTAGIGLEEPGDSPQSFYVNDAYNAAEDVYCTAAGHSANSGTSPDSPLNSLQAVLDAFDLETGDTIYIDTGTYAVASPVTIGADDAGVTVIGSSHSSGTNLAGTSALAADAVIHVNGADGVELRNLTVTGGWAGIYGSTADSLELADIVAPGNGWAGILLDGCAAPSVRCATLDGNGFAGIHARACTSGVVLENILVCGTPCGVFAAASPSASIRNATLHRNGWGVWFGNGSTNGHVANSIIATIRKRSYYGVYVETPSQSGFQSDYNDHYATGNAKVGNWSGAKANLSAWQSASGGDSNSLSVDPLLVDPDNPDSALRDYSLDEGSPCINAADAAAAPAEDIAGTPRGSRPDIGAYERAGANEAPTVDAGTSQTVTLPDAASLDATVTDDGLPDPPGSVLATWTKQSGPGTVTFANASAVDTTAYFSEAGAYVLRLTADDGEFTEYDEVAITVNPAVPENQAPSVAAGDDDAVNLSDDANLDGTVSDDDLPDPPASVTTTWTKQSGPGTVTFGNASAVDTTAAFSATGTYVLRLTADDGELNAYDEVTIGVVADGVFILPTRIQAEDYHNQSGAATIATDDVDGVTDLYCMWIDDWTSYNVYVPSTGQYSVTIRVRSSAGEFFRIEVDDEDVSGTIGPSLGSEGYSDVVATGVQLSAGAHVLKYYQVNAWGYDNRINWLEVTVDENEAPTVDAGSNQTVTLPTNSVLLDATVTDDGQPDPPAAYTLRWTITSGPETGYVVIGDKYAEDTTVTFDKAGAYVFGLTAEDGDKTAYGEVQITVNEATSRVTLPGRLEAEDYSDQGEGISYHDTTAGNSGGVYRSDDVDIESCGDTGGGYDVSWIAAGEWLAFAVDVSETKPYDVVARVNSPVSSCQMHVEVDAADVTGPMTFDATGGWTNVTAAAVHMTAGHHVVKVVMDTGSFKLNYVDVLSETHEEYIVQDGVANADIVISGSATRSTTLAADELQAIVQQMTGATLPIVTTETGADVHIYVGQSSYTDALGISTSGLAHDAYKIVSGGDWLALLGHDTAYTPVYPYGGGSTVEADWDTLNSPYLWAYPYAYATRNYAYDSELDIWNSDGKGSLNAVYAFLYDLGCRWYFPGTVGEAFPDLDDIGLPAANRTVEPDYAFREFFQYYTEFGRSNNADEVRWQLRLGLNDGDDSVGHGPRGHGIQYVVGREEYHTLHPEYYAIWGGERQFTYMGGTPCLSSSGLLAENVEFIKTLFDHYGEPMVNVSPSDGYWNLCECPLCEGKEYVERGDGGRLSDYVFAYVNELASEVYLTHPSKKVNCLAYTTYYLPPLDIETMSSNLVITFCRWRSWFEDPARKQTYEDAMHDWMEKLPNDEFFIWDYYLHARPPGNDFTGIPVYYPWIIRDDLRSLNGLSLGDYIEVQRNWPDWGLTYHALAANHLNLYLTARLYWNADEDVNAILEEYYEKFYGDAAAEMKTFVEYCEANWLQAAIDRAEGDYTRIAQMRTHLNAAIAAATGVYADRVDIVDDFLAAGEAE